MTNPILDIKKIDPNNPDPILAIAGDKLKDFAESLKKMVT
jgi:ParB-like chromosome segregation protein Spo0J